MSAEADLGSVLIALMRAPLYREEREVLWRQLLVLRRRIDDFVTVLGMSVEVDELKGYAYLRSNIDDDDPDAPPRLIPRRALSYPVSLLLALLRRRLAEHDATSADTRLVLTRDELVRLLGDFLTSGTTEARLIDRIDAHIKRGQRAGVPAGVTGTARILRGAPHRRGVRRCAVVGRVRRSLGRVREGRASRMTLFTKAEIEQVAEVRSGFRLLRLEVLNWGTFHGRVWVLNPGGANALLTGDIGSGKSTIVDAITTLLVPPIGRPNWMITFMAKAINPGDELFLDTSFALVLSAPTDQFHARARELADELEASKARIVTTRAVLLEIGNALSRRRYRPAAVQLLESLEVDPNIEIVSFSDDLYSEAFALYRARPDKEWGLVDCASFAVMSNRGLAKALTADEHYAQNGFRALLREGDFDTG